MAGNTFGQIFRLTTFGESHGYAVGSIIDGCPPGIIVDEKFIALEMSRRSPGLPAIATARKEKDKVEFLSGIFEGKTTGTPIAFLIKNKDQRSADYDELKNIFRPSHADFTYFSKYGIRDYRGGGRASARETATRVAAGALAKIILAQHKIRIHAFTSQIGSIAIATNKKLNPSAIYKDKLRCPDKITSEKMCRYLMQLKEEGNSAGGIVSCIIFNCPAGLGEPVFDKLQSDFAKAMLSIPAAKGFEYGEGFASATMKGSENNDAIINIKGKPTFKTNHAGGILGGISNGGNILFNVAFKPVSSIAQSQKTVNKENEAVEISIKGRHDVCIVPRAVAVVEAMAALVITDHLLRLKTLK